MYSTQKVGGGSNTPLTDRFNNAINDRLDKRMVIDWLSYTFDDKGQNDNNDEIKYDNNDTSFK